MCFHRILLHRKQLQTLATSQSSELIPTADKASEPFKFPNKVFHIDQFYTASAIPNPASNNMQNASSKRISPESKAECESGGCDSKFSKRRENGILIKDLHSHIYLNKQILSRFGISGEMAGSL